MGIECSVCGYEGNPKDAEFCETCGAELDNSSSSVSVSTTPSDSPPSPPPSPSMEPPSGIQPPPPPSVQPPPSPSVQPPPPPSVQPPPSPITITPSPTIIPPPATPPIPSEQPSVPSPSFPSTPPPSVITTTARLISKVPNSPVPEFSITGHALIGIFTPESGPVDIDLEHFVGNETISKQHAEIINENGTWMVKDSSTNGTYIKPSGQTRFGARIMGPTPLNDGDEVAFAKIVFIFKSP